MNENPMTLDTIQNELDYRRGSRILHMLMTEGFITSEEKVKIEKNLLGKYPPYLRSLRPKKLDMSGF